MKTVRALNRHFACVVIVLAVLPVLLASCAPGRQRVIRIRQDFKYDGQLGLHGVASSAQEYRGGRLVGEARCLRAERLPGKDPSIRLTIEEVQYAGGNSRRVVYKGRYVLDQRTRMVVREATVSGSAKHHLFLYWPVSTNSATWTGAIP